MFSEIFNNIRGGLSRGGIKPVFTVVFDLWDEFVAWWRMGRPYFISSTGQIWIYKPKINAPLKEFKVKRTKNSLTKAKKIS